MSKIEPFFTVFFKSIVSIYFNMFSPNNYVKICVKYLPKKFHFYIFPGNYNYDVLFNNTSYNNFQNVIRSYLLIKLISNFQDMYTKILKNKIT